MAAKLRPRREHVTALLEDQKFGEPRWLPAAAVLTAAALYVTMPSRFIGSSSVYLAAVRIGIPILALALMAPLALTAPKRRLVYSVKRRTAAIAILAVISAANAVSIVLLVHLILTGTNIDGRQLVRAAIHIWCVNVLVFALWYWQLDRGGPMARRDAENKVVPDFLFPQYTAPEFAPPSWQPNFVDYLYVSFTNSTAFSPTDTMPLTRWTKILMIVQSASSLLLLVMVAARAVNILG
ncbi:MAG: DUF1345 domain-containing protein [Actinobacteria bacterium]|nr:MAG: DUF1345 domain-containing protein [Actinomycetota bacterium]